eukprot:symbB.v1.2.005965.t1/scaffold344.1/size224651/7
MSCKCLHLQFLRLPLGSNRKTLNQHARPRCSTTDAANAGCWSLMIPPYKALTSNVAAAISRDRTKLVSTKSSTCKHMNDIVGRGLLNATLMQRFRHLEGGQSIRVALRTGELIPSQKVSRKRPAGALKAREGEEVLSKTPRFQGF